MASICNKGNKVGKQRTRERTIDGNDYISNMPDEILLHILSFLALKEWIVVSLLSKRWKYIWTKMSCINLDEVEIIRNTIKKVPGCPLCGNHPRRDCPYLCIEHSIQAAKMKFLEFVDRILLLHSGCNIDNLRLSFCYDPNNGSTERIDRWFQFCMTTNIKELELNFYDAKQPKFFHLKKLAVRRVGLVQQYDLPQGCFAPKMLKTFLLSFCKLKASCFGVFGSLQTLYLKQVVIFNCLIGELVSKCPVLEDLSLERCIIPNEFLVSKEDIMIKRLSLMDCKTRKLSRFCMDLSTPQLLKVMIVGKQIREANIGNATHLVDAVINIKQGNSLTSLLTGLNHCQTLTIASPWIEGNFPNQMPIPLQNLKQLTLVVSLGEQELPRISCLLRSSPNIESLTLDMQNPWDVYRNNIRFRYHPAEHNYWESQRLPFHCLQNHLKKITINGIVGRSNEVKTVRFLLQNAIVLEKVVISIATYTFIAKYPYQHNSFMQYKENMDQLLDFARATTHAEIETLNDHNLNNI